MHGATCQKVCAWHGNMAWSLQVQGGRPHTWLPSRSAGSYCVLAPWSHRVDLQPAVSVGSWSSMGLISYC
jgi:hypothetical protein